MSGDPALTLLEESERERERERDEVSVRLFEALPRLISIHLAGSSFYSLDSELVGDCGEVHRSERFVKHLANSQRCPNELGRAGL